MRINAVIPLSVPPERRYYGDVTLYSHVYATLIDALKGTENVTEFCEFKYRDTLRQQVGVHALYTDLNTLPPPPVCVCNFLGKLEWVYVLFGGDVFALLLCMMFTKLRFLLTALQFSMSHDALDDSRRRCFSGHCVGGKPRYLQRVHQRLYSTSKHSGEK